MKPNVRPQGQMKPRYTLNDVLDAPCKLHSTPGRPSAHTTRQCDFVRRIAKGEALPPPPPPPPQNRGPPQQQNQFPRQDAAYMIFTSESADKGSRRARVQEVNATMSPVPQYLHWSDCEVSWSRADHPAILPNPGNYPLVVDTLFAELAEHKLHVRPGSKPVKQPLRRFSEDKRRAIGEEIAKLQAAGFIMEVFYPEWLANPVLVMKKNDTWRMCIDYTCLNKACPKDPFALPRIDQVIDSTAGCELLSFLDATTGYHQIKLVVEDQLKTAFITPSGAYCYITMPFGLKNGGATYQRTIQRCTHTQLVRNLHVYVDDLVVKSVKGVTLLDDLRKTFANLRTYQIKLNPEKCVFGVPDGKLLGFLVSERGIECNPEKIAAIERIEQPRNLKQVQKFTGCLASLSRFLSRLGEKEIPLYQLMKKTEKFTWTPQANEAFRELKHMLSTAPILVAPMEKEPMMLYIAATSRVISAVMVVERPEKDKAQPIQRPVYYISEVLSASKQNYPHYQKMCYGVYMVAKRLKPYFQAHLITVFSSAPLADIMGSRDATDRVAKWAIEIANYGIQYEPRTAIKSQALADFLVDWAETQYTPPVPDSDHWRMHFDGSKMKSGQGAGVVLTSPRGDQLCYVLQIHFAASNNVAEYEALVHGIKLAKEIGIRNIECFGDSDLVVQQCTGTWDAKDANMASYRFLVQQLRGYFEGCEFHHEPRANNEAADALSKLGSTGQAIPPGVSLEHIKKPSITPSPESESIFISETDLEALQKAKEPQPAKIPVLKKQSAAQAAPASAEPAAPGAADCIPGASKCSKKRKAEGKQAEAAPDGTASEDPRTSGTAD